MKTVFLGGTCSKSLWRTRLFAFLNPTKVDAFNPVVADWTPACQEKEDKARATSDYVLYVLTPWMEGAYSVAEVVDDSNKRPEKTLVCLLETDASPDGNPVFTPHQLKALKKVLQMVVANGGKSFSSLEELAGFLNA